MKLRLLILLLVVFTACKIKVPEKWEEGWFEIHHINTKLGDATFFIFPDGTTLLFDAGEFKIEGLSLERQNEYCLDKSDTVSTGKKIAEYIKQVFPQGYPMKIDYGVISHFHSDHYGMVDGDSEKSSLGDYLLSGITEVNEYIPIKKIVDRDFPNYDYPVDLMQYYKNDLKDTLTFHNYLNFIQYGITTGKFIPEKLIAGSDSQLNQVFDSQDSIDFCVRNVKCNDVIWTGHDTTTTNFAFPNVPLMENGKFNENPLSLVLLFKYGKFKYYTGGDLSGVDDWPDVDIESFVAPVVGKVDAMALDHHGYKDATNLFFLKSLSPCVVIQSSLHVPHFQPNVMMNLIEEDCDAFALKMPKLVASNYANVVDTIYKDYNANVVIKVAPGGEIYFVNTYEINSNKMELKNLWGPYYSLNK